MDATGRSSVDDALMWLTEGRRRRSSVRADDLLAALVALSETTPEAEEAIHVVARDVLGSDLDPSIELLDVGRTTPASAYKEALSEVARNTSSGDLRQVTAEVVGFAQDHNPLVMTALALIAGLSFRDLVDRVTARGGPALPSSADGTWNREQISAAFSVIDEIVQGQGHARLPGAVPARPVELLLGAATTEDGWARIDEYVRHGIEYEMLLAQRAVGSAWLAHRQSTSTRFMKLVGDLVCTELEDHSLRYRRAGPNGDIGRRAMEKLAGRSAGHLDILVTRTRTPVFGIAISGARDGGTVRRNAGRLRAVPSGLTVPAALVLAGPGWASRRETIELVEAFAGRVFTERTLVDLAAVAKAYVMDDQT